MSVIHYVMLAGCYVLTFSMVGEVRREAREGKAGWVAVKGQGAQVHRVCLRLVQLVHYVSKGYHLFTQGPLKEGPWEGGKGLVHFCERGWLGCACPWHMDFRGKGDNWRRWDDARKHKGRHKTSTLNPFGHNRLLGAPAP